MCTVCGKRYPRESEDTALMHVNNDHGIHEQLNVLVDGSGGRYFIPFTTEMFETEYEARTYVMRDVPRMERLSALLTSCYGPAEDVIDENGTVLPLP